MIVWETDELHDPSLLLEKDEYEFDPDTTDIVEGVNMKEVDDSMIYDMALDDLAKERSLKIA